MLVNVIEGKQCTYNPYIGFLIYTKNIGIGSACFSWFKADWVQWLFIPVLDSCVGTSHNVNLLNWFLYLNFLKIFIIDLEHQLYPG